MQVCTAASIFNSSSAFNTVHLIKFRVLICIELSQSELNISVRLGIWDEDHDSVAILAQDT